MPPSLMRFCQAFWPLWLQAQELCLPQFFLWGKAPLPASLAALRQPLHFLTSSSVSSWGPRGTQLSHGKVMKLALLFAASICHHKVGETSRIVFRVQRIKLCTTHGCCTKHPCPSSPPQIFETSATVLWCGQHQPLSKYTAVLGCGFLPWTSSGWELDSVHVAHHA